LSGPTQISGVVSLHPILKPFSAWQAIGSPALCFHWAGGHTVEHDTNNVQAIVKAIARTSEQRVMKQPHWW
jgi:hypothetical protein